MDPFLTLLIVAAILFGTETGRAAVNGAWQGITAKSAKKGKRGRRSGKSGVKKGAAGKAAPARARSVAASVGRATRTVGAATARAAKSAGNRVGTAAQARLAAREMPTPLITRTREPEPAANAPHTTPNPPRAAQAATPDTHVPLTADSPTEPDRTPQRETTMSAGTEYDTPSSDGELLATLHAAAEVARRQAQQLQEFGATLSGMGLDRSVLSPLDSAAEDFASGAQAIRNCAQQFEAHYEDARSVASRGLHFRGENAA